MKCPYCKKHEQRSKVHCEGQAPNEDGSITKGYHCSRNHWWVVRIKEGEADEVTRIGGPHSYRAKKKSAGPDPKKLLLKRGMPN